jgi:hypothetical protein
MTSTHAGGEPSAAEKVWRTTRVECPRPALECRTTRALGRVHDASGAALPRAGRGTKRDPQVERIEGP